VHARLVLYKRIAEATDEPALDELKVEIIDRFGLLPPQAERLFDAARVRVAAQRLALPKVRVGAKSATLDFGPQPKLDPARLIKLVQSQHKVYRLEGQKRLHITADFEDVAQRATRLVPHLAKLAPA
jgi:transcription-repair coupling factor (superfamily II helicase)